ncbi:MAG: ABC transporter ATP-binding protein [Clostridia bacterium]|nr:ABC transporter ATP-binding protein [Clostridia bacterium]
MFKRFLSYYKPHMRLFIIDMLCAVAVSVLSLVYPTITQEMMNVYVPAGELDMVLYMAIALLGFFLAKALLNFVIQYWGHQMGVRMQADMRKDFFHHVQKLPFSYFDENKTGTIMSRIINDLFDVSELAHHAPEDLFLSLLTLTGAVLLIGFRIDWWLALIAVSCVPLMFVFVLKTRRQMREAFKRTRERTGEINANVESAISGIRVSRAYTATEHEIEKFDQANANFVTARGGAYKQMGIFHSGMGFFTDMANLVALLAGGLFLMYERINPAQLTAYILYISSVITPVRTLTAIFEQLQSGMTGFARFDEIMNRDVEAEDKNAIEIGRVKGEIEFKNVSFKYTQDDVEDDSFVLNNINLKINAGETVALVGPSGGGKTTICHLIPRFYELNSGTIYLDGHDITTLTRYSLRKNIGMVSQDVFLFNGTIKENIAYGNLDATDEEIEEAAKKACIHDYIVQLPDGYLTQVGERGIKLSGGQKQRVSIARAFLKNPPILILDEATSALDNITEMEIQRALNELSQGRTTLVVAHRLSTVKNADEILVVTHKGIEERGSHEQLLEIKDGLYSHLYKHQFKTE